MTFDTEATGVDTTAEQAAAAGHGVCQDFTHMLIGAARHLGIPARYVSGHLFRRDTARTQPAAHAWAECWVGDLGWVAFDPTKRDQRRRGLCPGRLRARLSRTAPVAGTLFGWRSGAN